MGRSGRYRRAAVHFAAWRTRSFLASKCVGGRGLAFIVRRTLPTYGFLLRRRPMTPRANSALVVPTTLAFALLLAAARAQAPNIFDATLAEPGQRTSEVSTAELKTMLAERSAIVLDARPHLEYAISHIPGALNVAAKPGVSASLYVSDVAEVGRLVNSDMAARIVLLLQWPVLRKEQTLGRRAARGGAQQRATLPARHSSLASSRGRDRNRDRRSALCPRQ